MEKEKLGINLLIEKEGDGKNTMFIASSPDINVLAEGKTIEEAKNKFLDGVKIHLKEFPQDKKPLVVKNKFEIEMPLLTKVFL